MVCISVGCIISSLHLTSLPAVVNYPLFFLVVFFCFMGFRSVLSFSWGFMTLILSTAFYLGVERERVKVIFCIEGVVMVYVC